MPEIVTEFDLGHSKPQAMLRSEEHTSELQSQSNLVCRLLLETKKATHAVPRHVLPHAAELHARPPEPAYPRPQCRSVSVAPSRASRPTAMCVQETPAAHATPQ